MKNLTIYYKKGSTLNISNQKMTNLADKTYSNDAINFKQLSSLDDKYIKRKINIVCCIAIGYANMMTMQLLNVAQSIEPSSAVNLLQLNNYNTFN